MHRLIREQLSTLQQDQQQTGTFLPRHVERQFPRYLNCGMLAHGFVRTECLTCRSARLVAFSCKGRTLCPSCGAKRMAVQAAHLLERVLPHVPIRQWVLSMPFDLRFLLASQPRIMTAVLRTFIHSIFSYYRNANSKLHCGAVAFIQRFDSALNLNVHFHVVVMDGGYLINEHGDPVFQPAKAPSHEALLNASTHIANATRRLLIRKGFIDHLGEWTSDLDATAIPSFEPPKFGWFTADEKQIPAPHGTTSKNKSTASVHGFSVHAGLHIAAHDRERLERLCRYVARPPFANEQLIRYENDQVIFKLSKQRHNGATHAFMSAQKFMRRICSLIPPAKQNLVRYFGVLGPAAKLRPFIVPHRNIDLGVTALPPCRDLGIDWASLLKRVYDIDVFECPCGGRMRVISVIEDPKTIKKILDHLHLPTELPTIHPARAPPQMEFFDECFDESA